ncbi:unnamed protein product, partial [Staurois parvus]
MNRASHCSQPQDEFTSYYQDCLVPMVMHGGGTIMAWAAISLCSAGPIITLKGRVTASNYVQILADHVHPMVQTLSLINSAIYQDYNAPIH